MGEYHGIVSGMLTKALSLDPLDNLVQHYNKSSPSTDSSSSKSASQVSFSSNPRLFGSITIFKAILEGASMLEMMVSKTLSFIV